MGSCYNNLMVDCLRFGICPNIRKEPDLIIVPKAGKSLGSTRGFSSSMARAYNFSFIHV